MISGGRAIRGWQRTPAESGKPHRLGQFPPVVRGRRTGRAGTGRRLARPELHGADGYTTTAVEMSKWRNQEDIEFCYYVVWCHTRCKVQSIQQQGDHAIVRMLQPHFTNARERKAASNVARATSKMPWTVDEPGEWYLDRAANTVYYKPLPGQDMTQVRVVAPAVEKLVELRGTLDQPVKNIHFVGITFAEAGWLLPSEIGLVDVQANFLLKWKEPMRRRTASRRFTTSRSSPANVVCHAAQGLRFERCTFTRLGGRVSMSSSAHRIT